MATRSSRDLVGSVQRQETIANWDGTSESGYRFSPPPGETGHFVQKFVFDEPGTVDIFTVCFASLRTAVQDFTFSVVVHADSSNTPGSLLLDREFVFEGTISGETCILTPIDLTVSAGSAFFGVRFRDPDTIFVRVDTDGPLTTSGYVRSASTNSWLELPFGAFNNFRNFAFELLFTPDSDPPPPGACTASACVEDDTTLCLLNDRFRVTADFRNIFGVTGAAEAGPEITPDTGYFHFPGDPTNVEVTAKLINACRSDFQSYWFFAAGLTDQEFTIKVCDTLTGTEKTYFDPLNVRFETIADTAAFDTCP